MVHVSSAADFLVKPEQGMVDEYCCGMACFVAVGGAVLGCGLLFGGSCTVGCEFAIRLCLDASCFCSLCGNAGGYAFSVANADCHGVFIGWLGVVAVMAVTGGDFFTGMVGCYFAVVVAFFAFGLADGWLVELAKYRFLGVAYDVFYELDSFGLE